MPPLHASTGRTISSSQFLTQLQKAWATSRHHVQRPGGDAGIPTRLGLAVSGGADSMALAYLCSQVKASNLLRDLAVTAFVVDHRSREESSHEARTVSSWLQNLGITSQILQLDWSQVTNESKDQVTAFETNARMLRFQALGRACRDNGIETLLLGHHSDDNVETALWRLACGAPSSGLACMPPVSKIPECHGLYGVSESGTAYQLSQLWSPPRRYQGVAPQIRLSKMMQQRSGLKMVHRREAMKLSSSFGPEPEVSTGGISICRPLLSFSKADLLATCQGQGIDFVSDPTNTDPTLTPRNAIRGLLESGKMPRALQAGSIRSMIEWSEKYINRTNEASDALLSKCTIIDMNLSAGWMLINFPSYTDNRRGAYDLDLIFRRSLYPSETYLIPPIQKPPDETLTLRLASRMQEIKSTTLRRITDLISPFPKYHHRLPSFHMPARKVFYPGSTSFNDAGTIWRQPFSLAGVQFRPFAFGEPLSEVQRRRKYPDWFNMYSNTWLLCRAAYMSSRPLPTSRWDVEALAMASSGVTPRAKTGALRVSEWQLWDHRFWFRVAVAPVSSSSSAAAPSSKNSERESEPEPTTKSSLKIRPLQKPDMETVRQALKNAQAYVNFAKFEQIDTARMSSQATVEDQFTNDAPGTTRFTLPVVVFEDENGGEQLIELPTLGLRLQESQHVSWGGKTWHVRSEWRYKEIDEEVIRLMTESGDEKKP